MFIFNIYLVARIAVLSNYGAYCRGLDNISFPKRYGLQLPRLLSVRFRIYAGFCKVLRFVNGMYRGYTVTLKTRDFSES